MWRYLRRWTFLIFILIGVVTWGASLGNGYVWDDEEQIVANVRVHSLSHLATLWRGSTFNSGGSQGMNGMYYKPLMTTFFALMYSVGHGEPWLFHLVQMSLHILNAYLLFVLWGRLLPQSRWGVRLVASLIFLVHPANAETVVYISALQDTLSFTCGIAGLLLLVSRSPARRVLAGAAVGMCWLLGLFAKETGVLWIGIGLLYTLFLDRQLWRQWLLATGSALGMYGVMRFAIAHVMIQTHELTPLSLMTLPERLVSIPRILGFYIQILFWPVSLAIDQQWAVTTVSLASFWLPFGLIMLLLGMCLWIGYRVRWQRAYWFWGGWIVGSLALHMQIFPLDMTVAGRWVYVPCAGVLGFALFAFTTIQVSLRRYYLIVGALLGITLLFMVRSAVRVLDWKDGLRLYSHDIRINQDAFDLHNNLGVEFYRARRYAEARVHFERSVELAPHWWTSYNNLGAYWEYRGDYAQAKHYYATAIEHGQYYLAYENYAKILYREGQMEQLRDFLREALTVLPTNQTLLILQSLSR